MNELEKALKTGDLVHIDLYLDDVSTDQFVKDVKQYAASMADKGAIVKARDMLNDILATEGDSQ